MLKKWQAARSYFAKRRGGRCRCVCACSLRRIFMRRGVPCGAFPAAWEAAWGKHFGKESQCAGFQRVAKTCRFALQNGTFETLKRVVLDFKTTRFATPGGAVRWPEGGAATKRRHEMPPWGLPPAAYSCRPGRAVRRDIRWRGGIPARP